MFELFLEVQGHEIIAKALDGEEALKIYKSLKNFPDIILMDHRMPRKDGLVTSKEILRINPNCKIIFISADHTVKDEALKIGAIYFLEKPIKLSRLKDIIERFNSD